MSARSVRITLVVLPAAAAAAGACNSADSHLYLGRRYDEARGCLESSSALDVVSGESASETCPASCLVGSADGGRTVYVSTMCEQYPVGFDRSGSDAVCAQAFRAAAQHDDCLPDGGSTHPTPPDAGAADAADGG